MKSIVATSKDIATEQQDPTMEVVCNYQDNYYCDQVCVPASQLNRKPGV